MAIESILRRV